MRIVCKKCGNIKTPRIIRIKKKESWERAIKHRCKHCLNTAQKAYTARKREEKRNRVTSHGFNVGALLDARDNINRIINKMIHPGPTVYISIFAVKKAQKLMQIQKDLVRVAAMM